MKLKDTYEWIRENQAAHLEVGHAASQSAIYTFQPITRNCKKPLVLDQNKIGTHLLISSLISGLEMPPALCILLFVFFFNLLGNNLPSFLTDQVDSEGGALDLDCPFLDKCSNHCTVTLCFCEAATSFLKQFS